MAMRRKKKEDETINFKIPGLAGYGMSTSDFVKILFAIGGFLFLAAVSAFIVFSLSGSYDERDGLKIQAKPGVKVDAKIEKKF